MIFRSATWVMAVLTIGSGQIHAALSPHPSPRVEEREKLISELGCVHCHSDLKPASTLRERTPDLSSAGLRYNPAYLFEYLQNPVRVRQHLGRARMPDFHLSEKEAVALVSFLQTQRQVDGSNLPTEIQNSLKSAETPNVSRADFQHELESGLICLSCHRFEGKGGMQGVEFTDISFRLQRDWMKSYLVAPSRFGVPPTIMPPQFYQVAADGVHFQELTPQAARKITIVADFLFSLNAERRKALDQKLTAAKAKFPNATAVIGETIFKSLNCAACHRHSSIQPRPVAPPLAQEGERVNLPWLENYLRHPVAIRPFGFHPGEGSRMPDFRLSVEEASIVTAILVSNGPPESPTASPQLTAKGADGRKEEVRFQPRTLSRFAERNAERLLSTKLSCLGCHRFGKEGGRMAPDLAAVPARLKANYVFRMINDPFAVNPQTIMPKIPMPEETVQLLANYLLQQHATAAEIEYLSLTDNPVILPDIETSAGARTRGQYLTHCAACHGNEGQGNGFNAQFLDPKPTVHGDANYMSTRPDDSLYDAISSGGYIMNRSRFMPPWGQNLSPAEVSALVAYTRSLCRCQGPTWSRDNSKKP